VSLFRKLRDIEKESSTYYYWNSRKNFGSYLEKGFEFGESVDVYIG
jgi:hypothetical protein